MPLAGIRPPLADIRVPFANLKFRIAEIRSAFTDVRERRSDVREPITDVREPITAVHEPIADVRPLHTDVASLFPAVPEPFTELHQPLVEPQTDFTAVPRLSSAENFHLHALSRPSPASTFLRPAHQPLRPVPTPRDVPKQTFYISNSQPTHLKTHLHSACTSVLSDVIARASALLPPDRLSPAYIALTTGRPILITSRRDSRPSRRNSARSVPNMFPMADATLIYHGSQIAPSDFGPTSHAESCTTLVWHSASALFDDRPFGDAPIVLLVDDGMLDRVSAVNELPERVVIVALDGLVTERLPERVDLSIVNVDDPIARANILDAACRLAASRLAVAGLRQRLARTDREFHELSRIGIALMHERDRAELLRLIVAQGKQLTESDGSGLLLLGTNEKGVTDLYAVAYDFDSLPGIDIPSVRFPLDSTNIVGHAAVTKEPIVVEDIHHLPPGTPYTGSADFQRRYHYHGQSFLAVPMLDQRDTVLGVLFFINRKSERSAAIRTEADCRRYVLPYSDREVRLARALAAEAGLSIENTNLYVQIESLLESLVKAAVSAIDERDPATAGHSLRVAALVTALADEVEHADTGPYRDVTFTSDQLRELRFAALLHDLGKVTVREELLLKAKKLPIRMWERVDARFDLIRRTIEFRAAEQRAELCRDNGAAAGDAATLARFDAALAEELRDFDRMRRVVRAANEPGVLLDGRRAELRDIAHHTFVDTDDRLSRFLSDEELHFLEIPCGTLDEHERAEVEMHVEHTRRFLTQIPWTDDLKNLVAFACGHHERLNGTGYPRGLQDREIPLQTRMIAVADMFDALTEADRPYKPALSPERAIEIIRADADAGMLDRTLVDLISEPRVYKRVLDQDWRTL